MLARRGVAPNILQLVRCKSTTTKPILFSPLSRKPQVAVTPMGVTLKFAKDSGAPVVPKVAKTTPTLKGLQASIEAKIKKALDTMGTDATKTVTTKAARSDKKSKAAATATSKVPKSGKEELPNLAKSTEATPYWVDASPTHIAIVIGSRYKVFTLNDGWMTKTRDVNWAETAAFELLALILVQQGRTGVIQVNSDSLTALRAISGERIRVPEIMESARRTGDVVKTSMFTVKGVKVSSTANLADKFTRGKTVNGYEEMKCDITIPEALAPFVTAV
ncbi:hypothetical protein FRC11_001574 [Ceratobasidium sp. 423]|nr:hypothetical protein FRC11_001574 [Ceratobasidium sp. 423]